MAILTTTYQTSAMTSSVDRQLFKQTYLSMTSSNTSILNKIYTFCRQKDDTRKNSELQKNLCLGSEEQIVYHPAKQMEVLTTSNRPTFSLQSIEGVCNLLFLLLRYDGGGQVLLLVLNNPTSTNSGPNSFLQFSNVMYVMLTTTSRAPAHNLTKFNSQLHISRLNLSANSDEGARIRSHTSCNLWYENCGDTEHD